MSVVLKKAVHAVHGLVFKMHNLCMFLELYILPSTKCVWKHTKSYWYWPSQDPSVLLQVHSYERGITLVTLYRLVMNCRMCVAWM